MMRMTTRCPSCGHDNRDEANYCMKCGVRVVAPPSHPESQPALPSPTTVTEPPRPLSCSFHPMAIATHLCNRCGRPLCRSCARPCFGMVLCPLCWSGPVHPYPWLPQPLTRPPYPLTMLTCCVG
ncbi:zinc-ribbon domain-containing protein [[Eubacterium] cellulosolvens]